MKTSLTLSLLLCGTLFADGAALYEACAQCHGPKGEKVPPGGNGKIINTLSKAEIMTALQGYKADTYGGKTKLLMKAPVSNLNDAQMQEIADYIGK